MSNIGTTFADPKIKPNYNSVKYYLKIKTGSGCGSVGRAVASNTRGPRFESSHRQKIYLYSEHLFTVNCVLKIKKKRPGMAHI